MSPFKPYYEPKEVIDQIKRLMAELGSDAFKINGRAILYSGPREMIRRALAHLKINHKRTQEQAERDGDGFLDISEIGTFLDEYDEDADGMFLSIYNYYKHHLGEDNPIANEYGDQVMFFTSKEFIKSISGDVLTAVCGSDLDRTFFQIELPDLMLNTKVKTVNGLPMEAIRAFYELSPYESFKLICLSELKDTYQKADTEGAKSPLTLWNEFFERTAFYQLEQGDPIGKPPALTAEQEEQKLALIEKYGLQELYQKEPWSWGGPMTKRAKTLPAIVNDNASPPRPALRARKAGLKAGL